MDVYCHKRLIRNSNLQYTNKIGSRNVKAGGTYMLPLFLKGSTAQGNKQG